MILKDTQIYLLYYYRALQPKELQYLAELWPKIGNVCVA